jgi:hypothetical protein
MKSIDEAFAKTTELLFGRRLYPIDDYGEWLLKRIPRGELHKSSLSDKQVLVPNYSVFKYVPKDKVAGLDSLLEVAKRKIEIDENDNLNKISKKLNDIAIYVTEFAEGKNTDVEDSSIYMNLYNAYKIVDCFNSKYIAYSFWIDYNEYTFGSYRSFNSKFSIHMYNSKNVTMSFEVDACKDCSYLMFSHNCENVHESLFCFNTKNKRYAIANVEVGREKYLEVKKMLVDYVLEKLEKKKYLDLDIYNIGSKTQNP